MCDPEFFYLVMKLLGGFSLFSRRKRPGGMSLLGEDAGRRGNDTKQGPDFKFFICFDSLQLTLTESSIYAHLPRPFLV